jgi:hypothetical protein
MAKDKINGTPQNKVIDVGAIVEIDDEVLKHGVLFTHPQFSPFKLYFNVKRVPLEEDPSKVRLVLEHNFEALNVKPQTVSKIVQPEKKLIIPS